MYINLTNLISLHYNITNSIIEVLEKFCRDGNGLPVNRVVGRKDFNRSTA